MNVEELRPQEINQGKPLSLKLVVTISVGILQLAARLPDWLLLATLRVVKFFITLLKQDGSELQMVDDLISILSTDPRGNTIIRRLFLDNRPRQLQALIHGVIKHQLPSSNHAFVAIAAVPSPRRRVKPWLAPRIALIGKGFDCQKLTLAYQQTHRCHLTVIDSVRELTKEFDAWEIGPSPQLSLDLLEDALATGITLSLHYQALPDPEATCRILELASGHRTPLRIFYPYLYFAPVQRLKRLIESDEIGELATVRIRATVAGKGGLLTPEPIPKTDYLAHPGFDHFLLLTYLGGPMEQIAVYLNPMSQDHGGQALISGKYAAPGRYGLLELTSAPHLFIRSPYFPYDLEAELAGSNGIIWLRRGMGDRCYLAPITVRVGKRAYSLGVESGVPQSWDVVYTTAVEHFLGILAGRGVALINDADIRSAAKIKGAVMAAAEQKSVVMV